MEAAAIKTCSRCGRTGIAGAACPDCGAPTYTPAGVRPATSQAATSVAAPLLVALAGAVLAIGSLFTTWYTLHLPDNVRGLFTGVADNLGRSFDGIVPGASAQVSAGVDDAFRHGIGVNGWQAFKFVDIAIAVSAGVAAVLIVTLFLYGSAVRRSVPQVSRLVISLGTSIVVIALYRTINQPDPASWFSVGAGPWLAVLGGAAMAVGASLAAGARRTYE